MGYRKLAATARKTVIDETFAWEVQELIKPGMSALFR